MRQSRLRFGAGALLVLTALYCLGSPGNIAAVLLPALAHECGHLLALWLLGLPVRAFRVELRGLCIEYGGSPGPLSTALTAAAGPLAGLGYALAAAHYGAALGSDWLSLTAGVSLLLSLFNLLPALPLDGGVLSLALLQGVLGEKRAQRALDVLGLLVAAGLLGLGFAVLLRGGGAALTVAAVWLLLSQENERGLVKRREIL